MYKVLIWDHTGESEKWCEGYLDKSEVEIIQTITPAELVPAVLLQKDAWDWILIFERGMRKAFNATIKNLKLPLEKIVYAYDPKSWAQRPKAIYTLLNGARGGVTKIQRQFLVDNLKNLNTFMTCTVENISYIATSVDSFRLPYMFTNKVNWASRDMKRFHELAEQYYKVDDSAGYFLDLGANIGTTGIYFIKNISPNLKLLAFEPDLENFKMHRVNVILNDLDETTTLVNCGLGNGASELMLYRNGSNTGSIGFIKHEKSTPIAPIKIIALDTYLAENKIPASEVKYVWLDTEGFEPQVLLGAKNLISENPAPIFMECNLGAWDKSGLFEEMVNLLEAHYTHFILFKGGNEAKNRDETIYPIETLRTHERPNNILGQLGDIFLIKRGLIA